MKEDKKEKRWGIVAIILGLLIIFIVAVMLLSSKKPGDLALGELPKDVNGAAFIKTNKILLEKMLENWMPNDLFWPTALLDNIPNFQIGQLEVVRYNVRVLRDNLSRMRTTDTLDSMADAAFTALSNDPYRWWFPSAESKWKDAEERLDDYVKNVVSGRSFFYPRADNLVELLQQYASLMGGVNTRLINAPPDRKESVALDEAETSTGQAAKTVGIDIPWRKIDDNFYYAQGVAYALYNSFKAIRRDFFTVLRDKNSVKLVDKIMESLGRCDFEPLLVLNGSPGSIFANHSLNLSGVFNDARQKVDSLIVALTQG
jgi:hypothetical protein